MPSQQTVTRTGLSTNGTRGPVSRPRFQGAGRTTASTGAPKRKRAQNNDAPQRNRAKKAKTEKTKRRRKVDMTYRYDRTLVIAPMEQDFVGLGALAPKHWDRIRPEILEAQEDYDPEGRYIAPPPCVPDPMGDSPEFGEMSEDEEIVAYKLAKERTTKRAKTAKTVKPKKRKPKPENKRQWPLPTFVNMPSEVRENILRHLLVAEKPILVFGGWKRIYRREQPCLDLSILRVNKRFYVEGRCILYGENTFLYRLRDATNEVPDLEELNNDEELGVEGDGSDTEPDFDGALEVEYVDEDDETDDGSEYGVDPEDAVVSRRRARNRRPEAENFDIDIDKLLPFIRHIIVEAEHNRFSPGQMKNMAKALQVFIPENNVSEDMSPNIHTLTIRVWPQLIDEHRFSFVNFFEPQSDIIKAIKGIQCQHLRIEIKRMYLQPLGSRLPTKLYRLDMRHHRMMRRSMAGLPDVWNQDRAMMAHRRDSAASTMKLVENLQTIVLARCEQDGPTLQYDPEVEALFWVWEDAAEVDVEE